MSENTQEQRNEIAQLRIETEQARAHHKRARFSQEYRSRILALRKQGVTHRHQCVTSNSGDAPRVIPVRAAPQAGPQVLSLRLGAFRLTIQVA
jgi:hypothetical protein